MLENTLLIYFSTKICKWHLKVRLFSFCEKKKENMAVDQSPSLRGSLNGTLLEKENSL